MSLLDYVLGAKAGSVSVVGTAKNVGKTVTLNQLINEATERGIGIGVTSTGREGEKTDTLTSEEKPPIYVPAGALLATAEAALRESEVYAEILEVMPYTTLMGDVVLGRVREGGEVLVVGPETTTELRETVAAMHRHGAQLVLVDGSIDRVAAAAPTVTDVTVLCTGAAAALDLEGVLEKTRLVVELFRLGPPGDVKLWQVARRIVGERAVAVVSRGYEVQNLKMKTALESTGAIAAAVKGDSLAVVFGGALTDGLLEAMADLPPEVKVEVVAADPTRILVGPDAWYRFKRSGRRLSVVNPVRLVAVSANPVGLGGAAFDPGDFLEKVAKVVRPLPVVDVVLGREARG
ncbi:MAG: hypothetical protein ACPLPR_05525 [Bacillota bacterium]